MTAGPTRLPLITDWHLAGEAAAYVRQSSMDQVRHRIGSAEYQRSQVEYLKALGFPEDRILVIDEDQGRSGTSTRNRTGWKDLVEGASTQRIRVVAMTEVSRFGRVEIELSNFLRICELNNVVLLENGVPRDLREVGDWTMMKLEAVIAEGENRRRTKRSQAGRIAKARKGIPVFRLPAGFERGPDGGAIQTDNAEVRELIHRILREALAGRSIGEIGRGLRAEGRRLPVTDPKGNIRWIEAKRATIDRLLKNPLFAGLIALYRHHTVHTQEGKCIVRTPVAEQEWIPGKIEAYITPEEFRRIQELLATRTFPRRRPVGEGQALCTGLLVCEECGARFHCRYASSAKDARSTRHDYWYTCQGWRKNRGLGSICWGLGGRMVDSAIEEIVLGVLSPPSTESLQRAIGEENERRLAESRLVEAEVRQAQSRVSEIQSLVERSRSRGQNPRVTEMYEDQLEAALRELEQARRRVSTILRPALVDTSPTFLAEVTATFQAFPRLWHEEVLGPKERKAIIGQVIHEIRVKKDGGTVRLQVILHTGIVIQRQLYPPEGRRRLIEALSDEGRSPGEIAETLHRVGILNIHGKPFTAKMIQKLLVGRWPRRRRIIEEELKALWRQGLPQAEIARQMNAKGIRTGNWMPWTAMAVAGVAARLGLRWRPPRSTRSEKQVG